MAAAAGSLTSATSGSHGYDLVRPAVIIALTIVAVLLTLFSFEQGLGDFFLLLFLLPMVLASIWYPRYALVLIGVVVVSALVTTVYFTVTGVAFSPLRYAIYTAVFVWIIAATSVFTMEGRSAISHALASLHQVHAEHPGKSQGSGARGGEAGRTRLSDRDLEVVLGSLQLPDPAAREMAIRSLGKSGDPRAVAPLIALLGDGNRDTREHAVRALGSLGAIAVEPLIRALDNPDWHVRTGSAVALRIIGDGRAIEPLIRALGDENRFVRREAAKSLGRIGGHDAVEPLIQVLRDRDSGVRVKAVTALARLGDSRAREPLRLLASDPDSDIRLAAIDAISKLKN